MNERLDKYEEKMMKTLDNLEQEFAGIRAGRANPHILDKITVDYYGTQTPLQQVGNISVPDPKCIVISPWENKMIKEIERAINCRTRALAKSYTVNTAVSALLQAIESFYIIFKKTNIFVKLILVRQYILEDGHFLNFAVFLKQ